MTEREQMTFYCFGEIEHWKYMDIDRIKEKVDKWIKMERQLLKNKGLDYGDRLEKLISIRSKIKYCKKNELKAYEVGPYKVN